MGGEERYNADDPLAYLAVRRIQAVIQPKLNRSEQCRYDCWLYKERYVIEYMFSKLKLYR